MNTLIKILRDLLQKIIDNIDAGNSNLTEDELYEAIESLKKFSERDNPMTKYQSAEYLHVSRATFDNLVKDGKLPEGKKLYQGDSNVFWYRKDLDKFINNKEYKNIK